ncbi:hypothetical protein ASG20_10905 [Sphingomonas sp. Leaf198]|nr:hypothetical protein ASG20_10905 [Sphingomonas sp. Leaf198]
MPNEAAGRRILDLKRLVAERFTANNWFELGALTNALDAVRNHGRLLRALQWGDADYEGAVFQVLLAMVERDPGNLKRIADYVDGGVDGGGENASSSAGSGRRIYITPSVFEVPADQPDPSLVAVMMPFDVRFDAVHAAIRKAAAQVGLTCKRADNMWENSVVIQDIFSLIYRSTIVVCDFTGKNPNVFYEAGIAHVLGKHVVPITQQPDDIPFDLRHHRYSTYLANGEGLEVLTGTLAERFATLTGRPPARPWSV